MSYGYLGDSSTKIKQVKKNDGIITASEAFDLESKGHLGGSWELIQTQSHSGNVSAVDFTSIKEGKYDVHCLLIANVVFNSGSTQDVPAIRLREAGTWEESTGYQTGEFWMASSNTFAEVRETDHDFIFIGNDCAGPWNATVHIYGAGDSAKYTLTNHYSTDQDADNGRFVQTFGGAQLKQTSVVDGIRVLGGDSATAMSSFKISLYGLKQI